MMRVHYMSDLHLEFAAMPSLPIEGDVLILAGDITLASCLGPEIETKDEKIRGVRAATDHLLDMARANFNQTFIIGGNHEPYGCDIFVAEQLCRKHLSGERVRWLENETVELNGTTFLFSTLWSDMNNRDPEVMMDVGRGVSDFHLISANGVRWTPEKAAERFDRSFEFIARETAARPDQTVVVVTHHAPTYRGLHPRFARSRVSGGFASELDAFIADTPQIRHWVFGHSHIVTEFEIGGTKLHANCRGYPREATGFNVDACFEI